MSGRVSSEYCTAAGTDVGGKQRSSTRRSGGGANSRVSASGAGVGSSRWNHAAANALTHSTKPAVPNAFRWRDRGAETLVLWRRDERARLAERARTDARVRELEAENARLKGDIELMRDNARLLGEQRDAFEALARARALEAEQLRASAAELAMLKEKLGIDEKVAEKLLETLELRALR